MRIVAWRHRRQVAQRSVDTVNAPNPLVSAFVIKNPPKAFGLVKHVTIAAPDGQDPTARANALEVLAINAMGTASVLKASQEMPPADAKATGQVPNVANANPTISGPTATSPVQVRVRMAVYAPAKVSAWLTPVAKVAVSAKMVTAQKAAAPTATSPIMVIPAISSV